MPTYTESMTGGALGGGASQASLVSNYTAGGGAVVGGAANYDVVFDYGFYWNLNAYLEVDQEFTWARGAQPLRWYTVEGVCLKNPSDCLTTGLDYGQNCPARFFQNILARSVTEVCEELQKSRISWELKSVKRWSRPADPNLVDPNDDCNKLEEVPFRDIPQCLRSTIVNEATTFVVATIGIVEDIYFYAGSGGLTLGGSAQCDITAGGTTPTLWNYFFPSEGGEIVFGGEALSVPGFSSEYLTEVVASSFIDFEAQGFLTFDEDVPAFENLVNDRVAVCNECNAMPVDIFFDHNLANPGIFYNFLKRSGLKIPEHLEMYYNSRLNSWVCTQHFAGPSSQSSGDETWTFTFELGCVTIVGGDYTGSPVIKFSMLVVRRDLASGADDETRVLIIFPPTDFCGYIKNLRNDFSFSLNLMTSFMTNSAGLTPQSVLVTDGIGFFSSKYWVQNPFLKFKLLRSPAPDRSGRKYIDRPYPEGPTLVGRNSSSTTTLPKSSTLVAKPPSIFVPEPVEPFVLGDGPTPAAPA